MTIKIESIVNGGRSKGKEVLSLSNVTNEQKAIKTTYFSIAGNAGLAIIKWLACHCHSWQV